MEFDMAFPYQNSSNYHINDALLDDFIKEFDDLAENLIFNINPNETLQDVLPSLPSLTDENKYDILSVISDTDSIAENEHTLNNTDNNSGLNERMKKLLSFPRKLQQAMNTDNMILLDSLIREYCAPNVVTKPPSLPEVEGIENTITYYHQFCTYLMNTMPNYLFVYKGTHRRKRIISSKLYIDATFIAYNDSCHNYMREVSGLLLLLCVYVLCYEIYTAHICLKIIYTNTLTCHTHPTIIYIPLLLYTYHFYSYTIFSHYTTPTLTLSATPISRYSKTQSSLQKLTILTLALQQKGKHSN